MDCDTPPFPPTASGLRFFTDWRRCTPSQERKRRGAPRKHHNVLRGNSDMSIPKEKERSIRKQRTSQASVLMGLYDKAMLCARICGSPRWPVSRSLHSCRSATATRAATGWCIGGPCRLPSRSAETTIRPFRPPLRPPAPTAFPDRLASPVPNHRLGATGGVPCASIIWLARAVKVVRPP